MSAVPTIPEARETAFKVGVLTTTRADYGHLYWVIRALEENPATEPLLYASGTHLQEERGATISVLESDGVPVHRRIPIWEGSQTPVAITAGLGRAVERFGAALSEDRPGALVVLGDRSEALAAALASVVAGVPVVHLHGGEVSLGSLDELFRHAVTKLASLHFPATEAYARRLRQLGEDPAMVHAVGAPGLDHLARMTLIEREELEERLGFGLHGPLAAITYHPVTTDPTRTGRDLEALLEGMLTVPSLRGVFTGSNADEGGTRIDERLRTFCTAHPERFAFFQNLGTQAYLSLLKHCDVVVGNSSSGIIEAPSFGVPTVNVGPRQEGRARATSVIDVGSDAVSIAGAVCRALSSEFRDLARRTMNPYDAAGDGRVAERIVERLVVALRNGLGTAKRFHDIYEPSDRAGAK